MKDYTKNDSPKKRSPESPNELAIAFLSDYLDENNTFLLRSWRDEFYEYDNGSFKLVSDKEVEARIVMFLHNHYKEEAITNHKVANIVLNIRGTYGVFIPEREEVNTWMDGTERVITRAFNNGLLVTYLDSGRNSFIFHSPAYFTLTKLPYNYDPTALCLRWELFLKQVMEDDGDRIELLRQWAKYVLGFNLRQHKFLLCSGEGANGKSVFFELIEHMVGVENCSYVSLTSFGDTFTLSGTLNKTLNSSSESSKEIGAFAENVLKKYTAGDPITFDRKFKSAIHTRPTAKIMIATNELPRFQDKTNGVWRRLLYVPFDLTIRDEDQNKNLSIELQEELSGIFNWAMGADISKGFIEPARCTMAVKAYRQEANAAKGFLEETYSYDPSSELTTSQVYDAYKEWCSSNGYSPLNESNFGKDVLRSFPGVRKERLTRTFGGKSQRTGIYIGLLEIINDVL